ncbi:Rab geranylgeranyltransferase, partial [Coemansia sp. RSA 2703]
EPPILVEISPSPRRTRRGTTDNDARETQKTKSNKRRLSSLRSAAQREDQDIGDGSGSNGVAIDELDLMAEQSPSKKLKKTVGGGNDKPDPSVALRPRIMFKCAVCLDSPDPAVFVHPCGHVFCESCAQSASQSTGKCPVCRHSMRPKDIRILQFRVAAITRRELVREPTVDEKAQSKQRVDKYCALNTHVMELRSSNVYSEDALSTTRRLLELNTELHTIWNYRRQILVHLDGWKSEDGRQVILEQELAFLLEIIMKNIKSYWMWNHRVWALSQLPSPSWDRELKLVAKLLAVDARNFHGWDYRRFVVSKVKEAADDPVAVDVSEFAFTLEQINKDFANHSAWHNRSKLLPSVLQRCTDDERKKMMDDEIELIINAIYTDPEDQNAWLYHEWLLDIQPSRKEKCALLRDK